jgi:hypothetical protein
VHVCHSAIPYGNERHNMGLHFAGRAGMHAGKTNRIGRTRARQRLSSHTAITSTTSVISTSVTRDRGMPTFPVT